VLLSRTNGFSFFIELIGNKQHVGSCHTNGGVALKHPFSFHSQGEKITDKPQKLGAQREVNPADGKAICRRQAFKQLRSLRNNR
jgi:hypothetical protein